MIFGADPAYQMSEEEFRLIRDLIYNHCGMYFAPESKYILEKRLSLRLAYHNIGSYKDYYLLLKYDVLKDREMSDLMDVITTNETYFFREAFQLKAFTDEIIPEIVEAKAKKGDRSLRIWSAGCSTGEEPYSIAMLLLETGLFKGWRIEIIGTDISQRVLQQARKGVYGKSSFRATDAAYVERYFEEQDGGCRINDKVRELVTISQLNLFDHNRLALLGRMDIIFCRNVIIYFDQIAKKKVVEAFCQSLYPGGFLLLGHSESLMNISTLFSLRHLKNDMVYQKPQPVSVGAL